MQFGIAEAVDHWAKYRPSHIAVQADGTDWTYAELNGLAAAMAAEIEAVAPDTSRVALAVGSKIRLLAAILGVLRTGRSVVLVHTGLPLDAIRINLQDAAVKAMLYDESQSHLAKLVSASAVAPKSALPASSVALLKKQAPSDEWGVIYSSGTTGVPKGIERDHESIVTELVGWCLELGLTRHSRFYIGRPIYYTGGLVLALATLLVAGTVILNDYQSDDSEEEVWRDYQHTLKGFSIDFAFFIPEQLRGFLRVAAGQRPRSARTILTMGSLITGAEKGQVTTAFSCDIVESWGNSESLGTITDPEDVRVRPESIGRPFLTDELFVVDEECRPVKPGLLGKLAGSESAGFLRYCNRPEDTNLAKRDELIISDDIGFQDESGFFYIRGRSQDRVLLADGSTVFVQELEQIVRELPMVQDCAIVAKPGNSGEARFLLAVVLVAPQQDRAWENVLHQQLQPRIAVERIQVFEELPRLPSGKINRPAIEQEFDRAI